MVLPGTQLHLPESWTLNVNIQVHMNEKGVASHGGNANLFLVAISHYLQPAQRAEVMMFGDPVGEQKCQSRGDLN